MYEILALIFFTLMFFVGVAMGVLPIISLLAARGWCHVVWRSASVCWFTQEERCEMRRLFKVAQKVQRRSCDSDSDRMLSAAALHVGRLVVKVMSFWHKIDTVVTRKYSASSKLLIR